MTESILISVVIPAFNRSAVITEAVQSVLRQDYPGFEIIVVDDCSKDNTADVVAAIPDTRVRLLRHSKNAGASAARNTAIAAAAGHLIAFLDSDDSWAATKLTRNLEFIRRRGLTPSGRWVAYNRVEIRTELGSRISRIPSDENLSVAELLLCNQGFIQTSAVFLPSALAKEVRFSEEVSWVDDWDFLLRLELAGASLMFQDETLSIHNAFSGATRVSNRISTDALVRWVEGRRASLSPKEVAGFYAHRIAPQLALSGRRLQALKLVAEGVAARAVSPKTLAIEMARAAMPERAFRALRRRLAGAN